VYADDNVKELLTKLLRIIHGVSRVIRVREGLFQAGIVHELIFTIEHRPRLPKDVLQMVLTVMRDLGSIRMTSPDLQALFSGKSYAFAVFLRMISA
jgi:hypothetical protein